jgi:hypothetical protein
MTDNEEVERIEEHIRQHPNEFQHPLSENEIFENNKESGKRIGLLINNKVHRYLFDLFNLEHDKRYRQAFENEVLIQKIKTKITNLLAKVWFPDNLILLDTEQLHIPHGEFANIVKTLSKVVQHQNAFLDHLLMEDDLNATAAASSSAVISDMTLMTNLQTQLNNLSLRVDIIDSELDKLKEQVSTGDCTSTASDSGHQLVAMHDDNNMRNVICDTISKFIYNMTNSHPTVLDIRRQLENDFAIIISVSQLNPILYSMKEDNILEMYQSDPSSKSKKPLWGIFSFERSI